jgi:hypothetical protein
MYLTSTAAEKRSGEGAFERSQAHEDERVDFYGVSLVNFVEESPISDRLSIGRIRGINLLLFSGMS